MAVGKVCRVWVSASDIDPATCTGLFLRRGAELDGDSGADWVWQDIDLPAAFAVQTGGPSIGPSYDRRSDEGAGVAGCRCRETPGVAKVHGDESVAGEPATTAASMGVGRDAAAGDWDSERIVGHGPVRRIAADKHNQNGCGG